MAKKSDPSAVAAVFGKAATKADTQKRQSKTDVVEAEDPTILAAADNYKVVSDQIKHLEGQRAVYQSVLIDFAKVSFAERKMLGQDGNFRIQGDEASVLFIAQNKGSAFECEHREELVAKYGEKAIDDLTEMDNLANIRFNPDVLNANFEKIAKALTAALGKELASELFLPRPYRVKEDVLDRLVKHAKSPEQLRALIDDLKITAYVRT